MSYFEHCKFALILSKDLFIGSLQSLVHAFCPSAFITSTTDLVKNIDIKLKNSGCKDN